MGDKIQRLEHICAKINSFSEKQKKNFTPVLVKKKLQKVLNSVFNTMLKTMWKSADFDFKLCNSVTLRFVQKSF